MALSSNGLGGQPLTLIIRVRIPAESPSMRCVLKVCVAPLANSHLRYRESHVLRTLCVSLSFVDLGNFPQGLVRALHKSHQLYSSVV